MKESSVFKRCVPSLLDKSDVVLLFEAHSQISNCFNVLAKMEEKLLKRRQRHRAGAAHRIVSTFSSEPKQQTSNSTTSGSNEPSTETLTPVHTFTGLRQGKRGPIHYGFCLSCVSFLQENTTRPLPVLVGQTTQPPQFSCPSGRNCFYFHT